MAMKSQISGLLLQFMCLPLDVVIVLIRVQCSGRLDQLFSFLVFSLTLISLF